VNKIKPVRRGLVVAVAVISVGCNQGGDSGGSLTPEDCREIYGLDYHDKFPTCDFDSSNCPGEWREDLDLCVEPQP
jgi:hypothetical protein